MATVYTSARLSTEVRGVGERSLMLLKAIEQTVNLLQSDAAMIGSLALHGEKIAEAIRMQDREVKLDSNGEIEAMLTTARDQLALRRTDFVRHREAVSAAPHIRDEDCVVDSIDECIRAITDLHNVLDQLVEAVGEHDADLDEVLGGTFYNAEDVIAALNK